MYPVKNQYAKSSNKPSGAYFAKIVLGGGLFEGNLFEDGGGGVIRGLTVSYQFKASN